MAAIKRPMINEALRLVRHYWGLSQVELSNMLGVSQSMVSEVERGTKEVSMDLLERYSCSLGVPKSQLLFFAEEVEGEPPATRGKLIVANKVLEILDRLKPKDNADEQEVSEAQS